jgi:hypothetical protein
LNSKEQTSSGFNQTTKVYQAFILKALHQFYYDCQKVAISAIRKCNVHVIDKLLLLKNQIGIVG